MGKQNGGRKVKKKRAEERKGGGKSTDTTLSLSAHTLLPFFTLKITEANVCPNFSKESSQSAKATAQ